MRKKNKLYTVNKYNRGLFAQGVDREHQNIFDGLGVSSLDTPLSNGYGSMSGMGWYQAPQVSKPTVSQPVNWGNTAQANTAVANSQNLVNSFHSNTAQYVPEGSNSSSSGSGNSNWSQYGAAAAAGMSAAEAATKNDDYRRGIWDMADPLYYTQNGNESSTGNALSDMGISMTEGSMASGNGYQALAGATLKVVGDLVNAGWGHGENKETESTVKAHNAYVNKLGRAMNQVSSNEELLALASNAGNKINISDDGFSNGWFNSDGTEALNETKGSQDVAYNIYGNNLYRAEHSIDTTNDDTRMRGFFAFGGPLGMPDSGGGAIDYGFMNDYLTVKNKAAANKNNITTNYFSPLSTFALGGDIQSNGSDFTTGLSRIEAGGTHEENPYDGVQVGISQENNQPNLVEEGETIFDDYVYSRRIKADKQTKEKFHLGKKSDLSYADISKKLEKESQERPNDAISQNGLKKQLHDLADEQERQKMEMQQKEMIDAFEQLPPEQQREIMMQIANQGGNQTAEQLGAEPMEGQPMGGEAIPPQAEQQMAIEPSGETEGTEAMISNGEEISAMGGKVNRYDKGGDIRNKVYSLLGFHTQSDYDKWAKENKIEGDINWEKIAENQSLLDAIGKNNPALKDAIKKGYDFGAYNPTTNGTLTFDFQHGGWGKEDYGAWEGSTDAAWKEAVEKGLVKKGMKSEELGNALKQTDAYQRGTKWLQDSDANRLAYLQAIYNSKDAPKAAKKYASKFVDANGWLKDVATDYKTIFEDPNGVGVRNTHPGTYWKTPDEMLRSAVKTNYVVNDDGTVEEIIGDVPTDWTSLGNYDWKDTKNDNSIAYYKRPAVAGTKGDDSSTPVETADVEAEYEAKYAPTWGRYAGLLGPAVGLGMQIAGIGKPDYSSLDAAVNSSTNSTPYLATYRPIGNYLRYEPMDIWSEQNRMNANSRAAERAITNNNGTLGSKIAGIVANEYNSQLGSADLYKKAQEYNNALNQQVQTFNRGTDQYNADAIAKTSATNAGILNAAQNTDSQLLLNAAQQKLAADASWNQGIYGNVNNIFKGLGEWGKENEQHNMLADMIANGVIGNATDKQFKEYLKEKKNKG